MHVRIAGTGCGGSEEERQVDNVDKNPGGKRRAIHPLSDGMGIEALESAIPSPVQQGV